MNIIRRLLQIHIGSLRILRRPPRREMSPTEGIYTHKGSITACGRNGCIAVYRLAGCHFCDAAKEILKEVVKKQGLSEGVINEIDAENSKEPYFDTITESPLIRVCDETISGLPLEDNLTDAIKRVCTKTCFKDVT